MERRPIRAAVFESATRPLRIQTLYIDEPAADEVLVRTTAAGLCHSDLHYLSGTLRIGSPSVLGHEVTGVVERVGSAVTRLSVGDHVVATATPSCGACAACVSGFPTRCTRVAEVRVRARPRLLDDEGRDVSVLAGIGAFAEAILVPASAVAKVADDLPASWACLLGCSISTGFGAAIHGAAVSPLDTVAVIGCGGVGMAAIQGARIAGARRVIAVDLHAEKLQLAAELGATDLVDAGGDVLAAVAAISPEGVTKSFEAVGNPATAELAFSMLAPGGTATILGLTAPGARISIDAERLIEGDRRIQGAYMGANRFLADIDVLADHARAGRLDLGRMVTATVTLDAINEGFEWLPAPSTIRTVVDFTDDSGAGT